MKKKITATVLSQKEIAPRILYVDRYGAGGMRKSRAVIGV